MKSKKALSEHFLVSLIIGVLIFGIIINKGCSFIPFGMSYRSDMLESFDSNIKTLQSDPQGYSSTEFVLKLDKDALFFGISPNAKEVKYGTYVLERMPTCSIDKTCICYCDRSAEKNGVVLCKEQSVVCNEYANPKFRMLKSSAEFFGEKDSSGVYIENGFIISTYLSNMPDIDFRSSVKLQRLSTGEVVVCMKDGLCVDELKKGG
jgi:hypothetical protein